MAIHFSPQQQQALHLFQNGVNMCLTGPGGTGKSLLIREMYRRAKRQGKQIFVTAMTGCAAYLLNETEARTLHGWSGVHRFNEREVTRSLILNYVKLIHKKREAAMTRWLIADILIIDEISMMSSNLYTLLDGIGRELRAQGNNEDSLRKRPFGGIQLILVGDFLQIPPVIKVAETKPIPVFECKSWRATIRKRDQVIALRRNYRALQDAKWSEMLLRLRQGRCDMDIQKALESRLLTNSKLKKELEKLRIKPTVLVSTHLQVDAMNIANLVKCPDTTEKIFQATAVRKIFDSDREIDVEFNDMTPSEQHAWREAMDQSLIPERLVLRIGAQVMCLTNIDLTKGLVNGARGVVTSYGMVDGKKESNKDGNPVVLWKSTGTERICKPVLLPTRHPFIFIKQVPLCQAWAITIHKSQGQTLDCAEVDIGSSVFEPGQAYVALSRVRSLDSLYIRNFNPSAVFADPFAKRFCVAIGDT